MMWINMELATLGSCQPRDAARIKLRCRAHLFLPALRALHALAHIWHGRVTGERHIGRINVALMATVSTTYPQQFIGIDQVTEGTGHSSGGCSLQNAIALFTSSC